MFGSNFRVFVSQEQSRSSKILKKSDSRDSGAEEEFEILGQEEIKERRHSEDSGNESQEEYEVLDNENQEIPANSEDSYDIIPKNLTLTKIINILNQVIKEDNCEELDKVVQNIEDYEGRSITLDNENLKDFCSNQLNLELQNRSNHQHIYSNILSQYKFDQVEFKYDYSVKELVLLAIAANDKLVEQYQDFLFAEENLSLLPLLVGGQKYIEAFIEKFHGTDGVYGGLKGQAIQLVEPNKIDFFSATALRKEQELLNAVFVEYVLRDFGQVLKTSKPDPLYGVLETASLVKNEEFITIVLDAFERYINEPTKKASTEELLKKSFATLLETAISQEHISVIEYLCKRYTNSADHAIYDVYEQAFADDKVITILRQQILKNIGARGRKEIYDLILKTTLGAGNIAFIERLCKECAECSNDVINYLDHKLKNNEFDETYKSTLVALSNVEGASTVINEPSVLSQAVNGEDNNQLNTKKNPEFKSTDSQQVIDKAQNEYNDDGFTPLHLAAQKGDVELGRRLLQCGANIEITSKTKVDDVTALHLAARSGHKDFVKFLLDSGANVNSVSSTGSGVTPLHEAAYDGYLDVAKLLIERSATVDAKDRHNFTPLMYASTEGNSAMVELLLQKKADLYLQNHDDETALHSAADNGHSDVVAILIGAAKDKEKYVNMQSRYTGTALHVIAYNRKINEGHKRVAKLLVDNGTSPYLERDPIINTPQNTFPKGNSLDIAKKQGNKEFLEFMSSLGYSVTVDCVPSNSNNASQNTKRYVIAAATLAMAGIISGVAVAVYLEMLAVGIAVGACCLVAAAVIYCCRPKNALEDNEVKKVDITQKSTPCCS